MTKLIGLTGGIASGKSTVGNILQANGFKVIDLDKVVHRLENENNEVISKITSIFGDTVIQENKVNRKLLAKIVFNDPQAMKSLIRILNPFLIDELEQEFVEDIVIIEAPTLFENGLQIYVDEIIMVDCNPVVQMERLQNRNHISISQANHLISNQWNPAIKKALSDVIIDSSNGIDDLKQQVKKIIKNLR